jgi:hypothetical protein
MPVAQPLFPADAQRILVRTDERSQLFEYVLNGQVIGTQTLSDDEAWDTQLKNGERHGIERYVNAQGVITFESHYENGREHGTSHQWSEDGVLIGLYHMDRGSGLDLWRCNLTWTLSEERAHDDGRLHGFTRWWNFDQRTVWDEHHLYEGREHGIFREWNRNGRLCRGFPKYYIAGNRVNRREYRRACLTDPTLPPCLDEENSPERPLPQEYLNQVTQGIGPRRCLHCKAIIGELFATICPHCTS